MGAAGIATGALGGAAAGAAVGSVVPVVGTAVGAIAGGLIGAFGGSGSGGSGIDDSKSHKLEVAAQEQKAYEQALTLANVQARGQLAAEQAKAALEEEMLAVSVLVVFVVLAVIAIK